MTASLRSVLVGTSALTVVLGVALALSVTRSPRSDARARGHLVPLVLLAIGIQAIHFLEELLTGFGVRFPETLGLAPWPSSFFVIFNLVWLVIWLASAAGLRHGVRAAFFPIWFLAIAMTGNGPAHVLLALDAGGYFPGLLSAPVEAAVGVILLTRLAAATERTERSPSHPSSGGSP